MRRARHSEQKLERRSCILEAALALFVETSFQAITMAQVAERAGVAKGTLYLYFTSKEAVFLAILQEQLLPAYFDGVERALGALSPPTGPHSLARLICEPFRERPEIARLLGILPGILEQNLSLEAAISFKRFLLARTAQAGATLERTLPVLAPGDGLRLILRSHALIIGLQQLADPSPLVRTAYEAPGLDVFKLDFTQELEATLGMLFAGHALVTGESNESHQPQG
ncbi:TetR family transcriptional regulator [bacterium]|nr:TetR family transcriptional regulator [bacterium]